ncbi:helix-turn-helix domain-containing protein [Bradyrhizobium sp. U87765 SZCCT0131]|uniref:GlxA family transcriptional regulator n=1 Tax=unclassified Bradyrhizobium TaxID=2631580 RepID=UPI001BAA80F9|nr:MULTISPECIES: helix-turn-helix domain-containing protein [unclassified Bradyrhizobium]MBR1219815.1 helix-turn-helix domain-containing protein [Bradyrhizobium sp. U87765 SZCCT0131]MBR1262466.1 helix-turn-helix domain-containing protein [Bradyrhizobium sp. U87765 SZCCT0134]MBR1308351.1 helix-turn-helix domain-containing protein [Bradyrhizobium sp. U87765 SZCCT0110]MBR1318248.1 helix-turn-helix domain-containing protein [Bradyrhizobium sp. U87765 SZCCT0109]MBR1351951.1 helix-turn-helix domain-
MTRVAVIEIEGCLASSAAITHDVLATANHISGAKRTMPFEVAAVHCRARRSNGDVRSADLVIVPGLGTTTAAELERKLLSPACRRAGDMIASAFAGGAMLGASCASTFLLAETGALDGRRATTTWWYAPLFRQRYPKVTLEAEQIVVADWPVATGGAAMAQMDLMLAIVDKFAGPSLAQACARYLLLDERRSQAPFMAITFLAGQDPKIAQAENWVRANIARDFAIDEVAASVALAPRTFARRMAATCGLSPIQFVQRIRLETARFLLETTRLPVEQIAVKVGYAEPSTLRRLIRRDTKRPPGYFRPAA